MRCISTSSSLKTQTCQWPSPRRQGSTRGQTFCWVTSVGPHISHTAFVALLDFPCRMAARENQRACWPGVPLWLAGLAQLWPFPHSSTREPTLGPRKQMHPAGKPSQGEVCQMERQTPKLWHLWLGVFQLKVLFKRVLKFCVLVNGQQHEFVSRSCTQGFALHRSCTCNPWPQRLPSD